MLDILINVLVALVVSILLIYACIKMIGNLRQKELTKVEEFKNLIWLIIFIIIIVFCLYYVFLVGLIYARIHSIILSIFNLS